MRQADGAELLDTDGMDREAVLAILLAWVDSRRPAAASRPPYS
jgi:hypothetical protein